MSNISKTFRGLWVLLLLAVLGLNASAQVVPGVKPYMQSFGGFPSLVASNMTTNVTCGGAVVFRGQGAAIWCANATVTNQATTEVVSFEASTNSAGDTVTNWFRPIPPITVTFTNNSGITTNRGVAFITPSTLDNIAQIRPFSFQNTATTNGWTNFTFAITVSPPAQ